MRTECWAFASAVEVDGAKGDGQLAIQLGDLGGQEGWRLGLIRLTAGDLTPTVSAACVLMAPLRRDRRICLHKQHLVCVFSF